MSILFLFGNIADDKTPYYWANPKFDNTIDFINNSDSLNTIFVGSSLTLSGINPILFDSLLNHKSNSFNSAWELSVIPETYFWLDNFIDNYSGHGKDHELKIFFEMNKLHPIRKYENNRRFSYMLNKPSCAILWEAVKISENSFLEKLRLRCNIIQGYMINQWNVGLLSDKMKYKLSENEVKPSNIYLENNGYRAAHRTLKKKDFKAYTQYQQGIKSTRKNNKKESPYLLEYTNSLISKASKKNIKVIFYMMPAIVDASTNYLRLNLPPQNFIDLGDPSSVLFAKENRKNIGHLNDKGANILTNILAKECITRKYFK